MIFLKLGGSLITDKLGVEAVRQEALAGAADGIATALTARPDLRLVLGHGSGSFGHVAASRHGTRSGVRNAAQWHGFAEVSAAAARLNALVREALLAAGIPAVTLQPSASAVCVDGRITALAFWPVQHALAAGLIPLVYGDVAFDSALGGTIISTEEVLIHLAEKLNPTWLLLAGETAGVLDGNGGVIPLITPVGFEQVRESLGGSAGTDVTGGMASKVAGMLELVESQTTLSIRIFSGKIPANLTAALVDPASVSFGTVIRYQG